MDVWPAPERNKGPIGDVLAEELASEGVVLEVASGTGQHAAHFARRFPDLVWQPSDVDPNNLESIRGHVAHANLPNLRPPVRVDAMADRWDLSADMVLSINMIHISPWAATLGLLRNALEILPDQGLLFLYGPFAIDGVLEPESNRRFDQSLKNRNPAWGVRDLADVRAAADGFSFVRSVAMPANNYAVVFRKGSSAQSGST